MGVFGAYSGSGAGALINPFSGTTAAETAAGVTPSSFLYEPYNLMRYGAVGDGVTDDTAAINRWILVGQKVGYGLVPSSANAYLTSGNHSITKTINIFGQGGGAFNTSPPEFLLSANATNLFSWNGLANGGPTIAGMILSGVIFNGGGNTLSDALIAIQGVTRAVLLRVGFHNCIGNGVRLRQFWDSVMRDCMWRTINASSSTGVLVADSRYNSDNNQNVNNLVIDRGHFEANRGSWIVSASDSNFDIFKLLNSKFEFGVVNTNSVPLINLNQASSVLVSGNNFDSITPENNYSAVFKLGDTTAGSSCSSYSVHDNIFYAPTATTVLVNSQVSTKGEFRGNLQANSSSIPQFVSTATGANRFELPRNTSVQSDLNKAIYDAGLAQHGFTNVGNLSVVTALSQDAASLSLAQSVVALTAPGSIFCSFALPTWSGFPGSLRVGIRCKSASGAGSIVLTVNTTDLAAQTVPTTTFGTIWFDIPNTFLSIMGQSGSDRFRIKTGGSNAEAVTVDGVYFMQVPWHYTASFTYDPASLLTLTQTSTTTTVTGAALGDHVDAYPPYDLQDIQCTACVSAANTVRVSLFNATTGTIDLASGSWVVRVTKR